MTVALLQLFYFSVADELPSSCQSLAYAAETVTLRMGSTRALHLGEAERGLVS